MTHILEARALTKTYGPEDAPVEALRGVDLVVQRGEFVAIVGPSGCGKSTLLHLLGGLDRPSGGEIWFGDERVDELSEAAWARLRRKHVGYVFQFFNLIDNLTAAANIELPARVAGLAASDAQSRRVALMDALGIADVAGQTPGRLSGGEQQRVAIARALVNDPELLLADEPTGNLDSATSADVMSVIAERHRAGQTIVMVTHNDRIAARADRVVRMRDGEITGETHLAEGADIRSRISELVGVGLER